VISGFWGYLGLPPSRASALVLTAFIASVCNRGNYFPAQGIQGILNPLENGIREKGGKIFLKRKVKKILVQDGKAQGVLLESGELIKGKAIISNADAIATFFQMVGEEHLPGDFVRQLGHLKPSLSAFSVYLGVKNDPPIPGNLSLANIIFTDDDMEDQYQAILRGAVEEMPYAISIPTLVNPSVAPAGHHIISLVMPMPYRLPDMQNWREKKEEFTERIIRVAEKIIPGLTERIVVKEAASPDTFVRYTANSGGAVGGWDYTPEMIALRPNNQTPIEGLWLTGHWTVPGIGIHSVIQSGHITASMIP
jgi:prolycopene isomerase